MARGHRCDCKRRDGKRCQCFIDRRYASHHWLRDECATVVGIACENHLKVLWRRGELELSDGTTYKLPQG